MADGKGGKNKYSKMGRATSPIENQDEIESAAIEPQCINNPDIGLGEQNIQKLNRNSMGESLQGAVGSTCDVGLSSSSTIGGRRDDSPFSLRHFLSGSSNSTNKMENCRMSSFSSSGGARPKVYPGTPPPSPRLNPEITSGLPDFVQDHLVVEQVYLNSSGPLSSFTLDNIPPHLPPSPDGILYPSSIVDLPFDLTAQSTNNSTRETPLDLPPPLGIVDVGPSKSLPDFLSDGPIRSERRHDSQPVSSANSPDRDREIGLTLSLENARLRRELEILKTQLSIHMARSESLEREVNRLRNRDRNCSVSFDGMIEQLEENLSLMTKRALMAENKLADIKKENQVLKKEMESIRIGRHENATASTSHAQSDNERLASQLRNAANTAELSLRQLLTGVENLRLLASNLDRDNNSGRLVNTKLEDTTSWGDSGDDDDAGPAL